MSELAASNSLADLAARIRTEHTAVADNLSEALRHSMAAGDLLLEAKAQLKHGQWLPWLKDHVDISERTAQLYMRTAKNRAEIEAQKRNGVADLTLSEAVALLALSSDARKMLAFMREVENLDGEELIKACAENNIAIICAPAPDPFHGQSADVRREWKLFGLWLVARGHSPNWVKGHLGWVSPFGTVSAWMGEVGDRFRATCRFQPAVFSGKLKAEWVAFTASHALHSEAEIEVLFAEAEEAWENAPVVRKHRRRRG